ncbi:MAG: uncharacterized protein JWL93_793 [Hyphomicrobiales bacterium]|jgi:hypothetical protein|nr:uncharacterized protein [Hyphomicrobiales bacterium]
MPSTPEPAGLQDADFETIEAAVNETARGRWFLAEFARRNRAAETDRLVASLRRIERAVDAAPPAPFDALHLRGAADDLARNLEDIVRQLRATRSGSYISGALAEQAMRAARLADDLRRDADPASLAASAPVLRLESRNSADDAEERRLIAQRMIEPTAFFVPKDDAPAPPQRAEVHELGQQGRLTDRLEAMRRLDTSSATSAGSMATSQPAAVALADIDAMPLRDRLRFFG